MSKFEDQLELVSFRDRSAWRLWLQQNHRISSGVWLVYYKVKSYQPSIRYNEAVQEALCFGWIDSKVKSLDADRYKQIFTPRKEKSVWSKLNKQYIEELIEQALMTEEGLRKISLAKQDNSWTTLDEIEALVIPADLQQALDLSKIASQNFKTLSRSSKKNILFWVYSAKRLETRLKRIEETISSLILNQSPLER